MSATVDTHTGVPDIGLQADVALEVEIDAACARMVDPAATEEASRVAWAEMSTLIFRRSQTQILKMEIERRLLRSGKKI